MVNTTDTFPPKSDMILELENEKKSIHIEAAKRIKVYQEAPEPMKQKI